MWQVRHKEFGLFLGVNHGKAHYEKLSQCCHLMGVYHFGSSQEVESFFVMAASPHLPPESRYPPNAFEIESWSIEEHRRIEENGLHQNAREYLEWSFDIIPQGNN
jgi:hypothetical protein